jgi:hypothetical protein
MSLSQLPPLPSISKPAAASRPDPLSAAPAPVPGSRITPLKIAARLHQRCLALVYFDQKYGKRRVRQIPWSELSTCPTPQQTLALLRTKYGAYFDGVDADQIATIVARLFDDADRHHHDGGELDLDEDLNKVTPEQLLAAKAIMNASFEQNQLRPGQDGYVFDRKAEFKPTAKSDWDDDVEDEIDFSAADLTDDE